MTWWVTALAAAAVHLVLAEIFDWFPAVARYAIRSATRVLPTDKRARYEEEWLAELAALPGQRVSALLFAVRILVRARRTARVLGAPSRPRRAVTQVLWTVLVVFLAPLFVLMAIAIKVTSPGPVLVHRERPGPRGRPQRFREFRVDENTRVGVIQEKLGLNRTPGAIDIARRGHIPHGGLHRFIVDPSTGESLDP